MIDKIKNKLYTTLRWSEKYTKTDMIYLSKGGFWLAIIYIVSFLSAFIVSIIFANFLSKEIYGDYKYIIAIFSLLSMFSMKKIGVSLIRSISRGFDGNLKEIVLAKIKWSLLGTIISLILFCYYLTQKNYTLATALLICAIFIPFFNSFNIYTAYLNGKKLFDKLTKYQSVEQIFITSTLIITILLTQNILIILFFYLLGATLIKSFLFFLSIKRNPPNSKKEDGVVKYGLQLSFIELLETISGEADKILIYHYIGSAELAIYSIGSGPIDQIKNFVLNIRTLALPKLSNNNTDLLKKTLPKKIIKLSILILPFIILYILLAPWIFNLFFPEYQSSIILSQILAISILLAPATLLSSSLSAQKKIKSLTKIKILGSIGRIIFYIIFIKFFDLLGLILARVLIDVYMTLLYSYYFKKINEN